MLVKCVAHSSSSSLSSSPTAPSPLCLLLTVLYFTFTSSPCKIASYTLPPSLQQSTPPPVQPHSDSSLLCPWRKGEFTCHFYTAPRQRQFVTSLPPLSEYFASLRRSIASPWPPLVVIFTIIAPLNLLTMHWSPCVVLLHHNTPSSSLPLIPSSLQCVSVQTVPVSPS